jgi:hypothetical protein
MIYSVAVLYARVLMKVLSTLAFLSVVCCAEAAALEATWGTRSGSFSLELLERASLVCGRVEGISGGAY